MQEARDSRTSFVPAVPEEEKYRRIYEASDASIYTDVKARIQLVNPAACELFGLTGDELVGRKVLQLFATRRGDPDRRTIPAMLAKDGEITEHETYIMRPNGERRAVALSVHRVPKEGGVKGYVGTVRDVTRYIRRIYTDHLTGLGNLAAYEPALLGEVGRAIAEKRPFALLWIDHDDFGKCNKRFGYQACSDLLRASAHLLTGPDYAPPLNAFYPRAFRWGGDEMPILLTEPESVCMQIADEMCENIRCLSVPARDGERARTTASIGVAVLDRPLRQLPAAEAATLLEERAGRAVFAAKDRGRDMVVRWEPGLL